MPSILHLDASARRSRSISRTLSQTFIDTWLAARPDDQVIRRDLAIDPPPHVTEEWIAAAFTPTEQRDMAMRDRLSWSDAAIDELSAADILVFGTPMYNYGMPSALKAWFDQVVRVGRTFSFDLSRGDWPLEPVLSGKRLVVLSARGEFGFAAEGLRGGWNHLDPHIATCARYLGVAQDAIETVAVEYQEFGDERHARSRDLAATQVKELAISLAAAFSQ
ncbi:FMN-dependent NADH-azoreductase [Rhizobium miluonense]|uniref:FMN dependent NADH:quinone oxidoreductase n=1 Tax=Rhizobium miluonense TaxID=411945 RepID=A0A1C3U0K5_9HYPH|nr:NAD(P)H-dependent oxidoreductase [Rhizobium miluonense]SCB09004.1 FMN-dependent NADH-azoreductase [Rhizobium miluonense]